MKVIIAQLDPTIGDFKGNSQKIISALKKAQEEKAEIALFAEMSLCGYPPEDLTLHHEFSKMCEKALEEILPYTQGLMAVVGLVRRNPARNEKALMNSAAILQDGKLVGFYDKALLPTYDVFDERRYFEPGREFRAWEWKGKKIGVLICEDIWQHSGFVTDTQYACDPVLEMKKLGVDLLLNLSASPYHFEKPEIRFKVCQKAAKTLKCPVILCAQVGGNDQLVFDGYSVYVDQTGNLCQLGKGFEEDLMVADLDALPKTIDLKTDGTKDLFCALVLGTRDYFRKQNFTKAIIGLSGGIDSALTAVIAVEALGKENVHGLLMPSRFSSVGSITDSQILAKNLGIQLTEVSIEPLYESYLKVLKPFFEGKPFDVTEENIQARIRGMILMAFSNKFGYLVLSTGNKSELAMGYCTLYGDMAGGLAVIADVNKKQVYALAHWVNRKGEIIPFATLEKVPSAELRPGQRDTDTLPNYATLDAVVEGYVENFLSPDEIASKHQIPVEIVKDIVHRIHLAEYKRRQAPVGIRVTRKAFKIGHRYPIVQKWM